MNPWPFLSDAELVQSARDAASAAVFVAALGPRGRPAAATLRAYAVEAWTEVARRGRIAPPLVLTA